MTDGTQWMDQLREYATKVDPSKISSERLFDYSDTSVTVYDRYKKSHYHFLVLPRPRKPFEVEDMDNLRTLLKKDKQAAKEVLLDLGEAAKKTKARIEEEMLLRWEFKWDIWIGFHAVPSMRHLHLHVISADLRGEYMKHKKHYNSFHPKLGFFIHLDEVMSWFEAEPSFWKQKSALKRKPYEELLGDPLECFYCHEEIRNMPQLKDHLKVEFDNMRTSEKERLESEKEKAEKKRAIREKLAKQRQAKEAREESAEKDETGSPVRKKARLEGASSEESVSNASTS